MIRSSNWPAIREALKKENLSIIELKKKLKLDSNTICVNLRKQRAAGVVVRETVGPENGPGKRRWAFQRRKKVVWRLV